MITKQELETFVMNCRIAVFNTDEKFRRGAEAVLSILETEFLLRDETRDAEKQID